MKRFLCAAVFVSVLTPIASAQKSAILHVVLQTDNGDIEVELDAAKAPGTVANFLRYVDAKHYDGGRFHRTVTPDNQPKNKVKIEVIQAGVHPDKSKNDFPPIKLERTRDTGLKHTDGAISMARDGPDTATSDFFLCIGDQPELDFGGKRNPDGQGFAAFGRVVKGMDVVKKIQTSPADGQTLTPPVTIRSIVRQSIDLIDSIKPTVVRNNRDGSGTTWFHPRGCLIPGPKGPIGFMTLQSIAGSDYFGPVHWSITTDNAKTWSDPAKVPGLGRMPTKDNIEQGVCDVVPEYHAKTDTILAMGHTVNYKNGKFFTPQPRRWPVYVIRNADGTWTERQKLEWDDPRGTDIYTAGCAQRVTLPDGDILVPISFGDDPKKPRSVATLRCSYDGKTLAVRETGKTIPGKVARGLLEPSLAFLDGVYYMTIRAEDGHGYVTASKNGLDWDAPKAWSWTTGDALTMSTTQQRWLVHSDALYLVYTRKSDVNATVPRWRSPLYLALVSRPTLKLVRDTERVVFPLEGDGVKDGKKVPYSGNFHTMPLGPNESLITDGETFPANGFKGNQLQARITWKAPNRPLVKALQHN